MSDIIGYGAEETGDEFGADIIGALEDLAGYDETGDDLAGALEELAGYEETGDDLARLIEAATSGYDESGDDIVGALKKAMRARGRGGRGRGRGGRRQPPARALQPSPGRKVELRPSEFTKVREYPLGFDSVVSVPALGGSLAITARPQVKFRGDRLLVPSDIAGIFVISDIKVGKNSQLAASGAIPGRTFQENAVGIRLGLDTAQVAMDITLLVTNISGAPARFFATLIGTALE